MSKSGLEETFLRQLQMLGIAAPIREYRFARVEVGDEPTPPARPGLRDRLAAAGLRDWALDFAWPEHRVAVEIEGGVWSRGRHTRGAGYVADCEKYNAATRLGWRLLRFTRESVDDWSGADMVTRILEETL